jgi:putative endopeptidase
MATRSEKDPPVGDGSDDPTQDPVDVVAGSAPSTATASTGSTQNFKHFRCACCNNPWNMGGTDGGNNIDTSSAVDRARQCRLDSKGYSGINPDNFDDSVDYSDDFFSWSNGNWIKKNPIPPEYSSWNTFMVLRDLNLDRLKAILDEAATAAATGKTSPNPEFDKVSTFFNTFMNEAEIEAKGIKDLVPVMDSIDNANCRDLSGLIAELHARYNVRSFFSLSSSPDRKNSVHTLANITQSGLGLPDKDYYFDDDKQAKREKYVEYIAAVLEELGRQGIAAYADIDACRAVAHRIFDFEVKIARSHLTRAEMRDAEKTYNKKTLAELTALTHEDTWADYLSQGVSRRAFDWQRYLACVGKPAEVVGDVNLTSPSTIRAAVRLMAEPVVKDYLRFQVINAYAPHLYGAISDLHFAFFEKELKGTSEQRPRWKRALDYVEAALGEALGQEYVAKHFSGDSKVKALAIVEQVRDVLRDRLQEIEWMQPQTKSAALLKMERFNVKIGYPDQWLNYGPLFVAPDSHIDNVLRANYFHFQIELQRINSPTDRTRWFMTPQTVNAYYHPSLNEIVFPAAILQPPFFDPTADEAVNFGSLGAVVGHEMTHGYDDQGRKYNHEGNMVDWWAPQDATEYEKRAAVMIK